MSNHRKPSFAIIGSGNGGHAFYAHLSQKGIKTSMFEIDKNRASELTKKGYIVADGEIDYTGPLEVTNNINAAIKGKDIIMIVIPSIHHKSIVEKMLPFLVDGQIIILNPGATGGALQINQLLKRQLPETNVIVAETSTLLYACRSTGIGKVTISGIKDKLLIAALPATETNHILQKLNIVFPQYKGAQNVIETSLSNVNAIVHPAPTILNAGRIESQLPFKYYLDGVTPSIGYLVEQLDKERLAIGQQFSLNLQSISSWYSLSYNVDGATLCEKISRVEAYQNIQGQDSLNTRYLFEDIPTGLIPMIALAKKLNVKTPIMEAIVQVGNALLNRDFYKEGRNLDDLGLNSLTYPEILTYVNG